MSRSRFEIGMDAILKDNDNNSIDFGNVETVGSMPVLHGERAVYYVNISAANVSVTVNPYMLVSLTSATFKHTNNVTVVIDSVRPHVNPSNIFSGNVQIGYISDTNMTNATFNPVMGWRFTATAYPSKGGGAQAVNDAYLKCSPASILSTKSLTDTAFNSTTRITGPDGGTYKVANGDLVLKIARTAGVVDFDFLIGYHTDK